MTKLFEKYITDDYKVKWDYVETIPEFAKLKECEQNPKWHGEGNAWQHTVKCVEAAQKLIKEDYCLLSDKSIRILLTAVLFHDIGKGTTTEFTKGNWHSYGHEVVGERIARRMLWDEDFSARETVCSLIRWHMDVLRVAESRDFATKLLRMSCYQFFTWQYAIFVKMCDCLGSQPEDENQTNIDMAKLRFLKRFSQQMNCYDISLYKRSFDRRKIFGKNVNWESTDPDKGKTQAFMFIGLPGAGKNTAIDDMFKDRDIKVLSRDDIRAELGYCGKDDKIIGTPEQEKKVSEIFNKRLAEYAKNGVDFVINNINLKKKYRDDYHTMANQASGNNIEWVYVYIEAPSLQSNINRREGQIKANAFNDMIEKFDWPTADEYDEFFIKKQLQD